MITVAPPLSREPSAQSVLAALRATPLGASLEADPASWQLDETHATSLATYLVLSQGRAELRVALADGVVVEEDWQVRVLPPYEDAGSLEDQLVGLARDIEDAAEEAEELLREIGTRSDGSGSRERWTLGLCEPLERMQEAATDVAEWFRRGSRIAGDAAELIAEGRPA